MARAECVQASPRGCARRGSGWEGAPFRTTISEVGEGDSWCPSSRGGGGYVGAISLGQAHRLPWTVEELALARMASVQTNLAWIESSRRRRTPPA